MSLSYYTRQLLDNANQYPPPSTLFGGFRTNHGVAMTKVGLSAYSLEGSLDAEGALNI